MSRQIEVNEVDEDVAYILGVLFGDGSIHKDKRYSNSYKIELTAKHEVFVKSFGEALKRLGLSPRYSIKHVKWCNKDYRRVVASNKGLNWFYNLRVEALKALLDKPELKIAFLRGFYESEGCLKYSYANHKRTHNLRIEIHNSNLNLLNLVKKLMITLGFNTKLNSYKKRNRQKTYYCVCINKQNEVKKFMELVKPCIKYRRD